VTVEYPDLAGYIAVARAVTGIEPGVVLASMKADLADSALHAPAGSWSDEDFYSDFIDKAAVLLVRLAKNHPLLDGNKRAAWVTLRLFVEMNVVEMNGWTWRAYPGVDEAEQAVLAVSSSEWDEEQTAAWLRPLLDAPSTTADK
jgi:death-on-curing protein